jgi:hypothetical protein
MTIPGQIICVSLCDCPKAMKIRKTRQDGPAKKHVRTAAENKLPQRDMHLVLKILTVVTSFFEMVRPSDLPTSNKRSPKLRTKLKLDLQRCRCASHCTFGLGGQLWNHREGSGAKPSVFGFHDNVKLFGSRMSGQ